MILSRIAAGSECRISGWYDWDRELDCYNEVSRAWGLNFWKRWIFRFSRACFECRRWRVIFQRKRMFATLLCLLLCSLQDDRVFCLSLPLHRHVVFPLVLPIVKLGTQADGRPSFFLNTPKRTEYVLLPTLIVSFLCHRIHEDGYPRTHFWMYSS